MRVSRLLLLTAAYAALVAPAAHAQRRELGEYNVSELCDYFSGLAQLGVHHARAYQIYGQLQGHSGKTFPVYFAQTGNWGQAHSGGAILLDVSTLNKATPILAFVLAHEWGHEDLGHQANVYRPDGSAWRLRSSPTQSEDEADAYAGRFLARYEYDLDLVVRYLSTLPRSPGGDSHNDGPDRARTVAQAFAAAGGRKVVSSPYSYCGGGVDAGTTRPAPTCQQVTDWEERTGWVVRPVPQQVRCQHCGCGPAGCGCMHAFDVITVAQQVPVTQRVPVTRTVCR